MVSPCCLFIFDRIIIEVAGNQDRHKSSIEFDFGPNQTAHFGVTCPWVTKILHFELEYIWNQLAYLDQILCVASLGWGKGCIRFWGGLDQNSGFLGNRKPSLTYNGKNDVSTFSRLIFIRSFLYLQVHAWNLGRVRISARLDTDYGVSCPWGLKKSHRLIMGKWCLHVSSYILDQIVIKVAGIRERHKTGTGPIFGPLVSMAHLYVWNEIWPWHIGLRWAIVALWATCFLISWTRSDGYSSISANTLISIRYTYIRKSKG